MNSERGIIGWLLLVAFLLVLAVVGLVQCVIPGDSSDDRSFTRVELAENDSLSPTTAVSVSPTLSVSPSVERLCLPGSTCP